MADIPFTQYLLPNGRKIDVKYTCADEADSAKALAIIAAGFFFECEVLTTGHAAFTISDRRCDEDVGGPYLATNDEASVTAAVSKLINSFDLTRYPRPGVVCHQRTVDSFEGGEETPAGADYDPLAAIIAPAPPGFPEATARFVDPPEGWWER